MLKAVSRLLEMFRPPAALVATWEPEVWLVPAVMPALVEPWVKEVQAA